MPSKESSASEEEKSIQKKSSKIWTKAKVGRRKDRTFEEENESETIFQK